MSFAQTRCDQITPNNIQSNRHCAVNSTKVLSCPESNYTVYRADLAGKKSSSTQLALLPTPVKREKASLQIAPVPANIALGDRYFLTVQQGDRSWFFPVQFTAIEAHWFLPQLERLDWSLEAGVPADLPKISAIIERAIDSRLAGGVK